MLSPSQAALPSGSLEEGWGMDSAYQSSKELRLIHKGVGEAPLIHRGKHCKQRSVGAQCRGKGSHLKKSGEKETATITKLK